MGCGRCTAEQLRALRLVQDVVPPVELTATALSSAQKLAAKPFRTMAQVKANINATARSSMPPVMVEPGGLLAMVRDAMVGLCATC